MPKINSAYDQLANADSAQVANLTMTIISKMQDKPGRTGEQAAAAACVFLLMCERFDIDPVDAFLVSKNLMRKSDQYNKGQQFAAARHYLKEELKV